MLDRLGRGERMRLMKFVCSFAWADLEIRPEERQFIREMVTRLALDEEEEEEVQAWLELPPAPESIDPTLVPSAHRQVFIEAIKGAQSRRATLPIEFGSGEWYAEAWSESKPAKKLTAAAERALAFDDDSQGRGFRRDPTDGR